MLAAIMPFEIHTSGSFDLTLSTGTQTLIFAHKLPPATHPLANFSNVFDLPTWIFLGLSLLALSLAFGILEQLQQREIEVSSTLALATNAYSIG